jgi:hypothetical protein
MGLRSGGWRNDLSAQETSWLHSEDGKHRFPPNKENRQHTRSCKQIALHQEETPRSEGMKEGKSNHTLEMKNKFFLLKFKQDFTSKT